MLAGGHAVRARRLHGRLDDDDDRFSVEDYNTWPTLAMMTLVGLMFVGGSAGSTTGSVKVVRHLLLGKILRREIDQTLHPEIVLPVRLNRTRRRRADAARGLVVRPALHRDLRPRRRALAIDAARTGSSSRPSTPSPSRRACSRNVGPAFGFAGPFGSFEPFSDFSTLVMIGLMWLGRLEMIPIVVLSHATTGGAS